MRKTFCLLITFFCLLSSSMARGETTPVITVSSPLELINAIGPDRIIRIDRDVLELPAERVAFNNEFVVQEEVPDGYQLSIRNVSNLTITSVGEKPVRILAQPRYAYILAFQNVENIKISRVEAGHTPGDNVCIAGVLYFENSRCIELDQTVLFGCGSRGVELSGVSDFTFKDSEIRECVYGIMTIDQSHNCLFVNSVFAENEGWYLIDVGQSKNIRFSQCQIENNEALSSESSSIFDVSNSEEVLVEDCVVEGNTAAWFIDNGDGLVVKDTPLGLNRFISYRPSYREKYSYEDYYENLYLLQFYQIEDQMRGEVRPRPMMKDIKNTPLGK